MLNESLPMSRLPQIAAPTRKPYLSHLSDHEGEQVNYVRTKILVSEKSIIQIRTSMFQDLWYIFLIPLRSRNF